MFYFQTPTERPVADSSPEFSVESCQLQAAWQHQEWPVSVLHQPAIQYPQSQRTAQHQVSGQRNQRVLLYTLKILFNGCTTLWSDKSSVKVGACKFFIAFCLSKWNFSIWTTISFRHWISVCERYRYLIQYYLLFHFAIIYSFEVHSLHFMTQCDTNDTFDIFRDAVFNQFVNFWKPVVHLDTKIW